MKMGVQCLDDAASGRLVILQPLVQEPFTAYLHDIPSLHEAAFFPVIDQPPAGIRGDCPSDKARVFQRILMDFRTADNKRLRIKEII